MEYIIAYIGGAVLVLYYLNTWRKVFLPTKKEREEAQAASEKREEAFHHNFRIYHIESELKNAYDNILDKIKASGLFPTAAEQGEALHLIYTLAILQSQRRFDLEEYLPKFQSILAYNTPLYPLHQYRDEQMTCLIDRIKYYAEVCDDTYIMLAHFAARCKYSIEKGINKPHSEEEIANLLTTQVGVTEVTKIGLWLKEQQKTNTISQLNFIGNKYFFEQTPQYERETIYTQGGSIKMRKYKK